MEGSSGGVSSCEALSCEAFFSCISSSGYTLLSCRLCCGLTPLCLSSFDLCHSPLFCAFRLRCEHIQSIMRIKNKGCSTDFVCHPCCIHMGVRIPASFIRVCHTSPHMDQIPLSCPSSLVHVSPVRNHDLCRTHHLAPRTWKCSLPCLSISNAPSSDCVDRPIQSTFLRHP